MLSKLEISLFFGGLREMQLFSNERGEAFLWDGGGYDHQPLSRLCPTLLHQGRQARAAALQQREWHPERHPEQNPGAGLLPGYLRR